MAIAVCPAIVENYWDGHKELKEKLGVHAAISLPVVKAVGLLRNIVAWLGQQPRFARRLKAVPGLLTEDQVRLAQAGWEAFCQGVLAEYTRIYNGEKGEATAKNDQVKRIEAILKTEKPTKALIRVFYHHADKALAGRGDRSEHRAKLLRDAVYAGVEAVTFYRPETGRRLNWTKDDNGHLYRKEGTWRMKVPPSDLKNEKTLAGSIGDDRKINDLGNRLYDCLEEYLEWARDALLAGRVSDTLFVCGAVEPRYTAKALGSYYRRLSRAAMKDGHRDYHGCAEINVIGVRKAGATETYNKTNSFEEAGKRLRNDARSAQVYVNRVAANQTKNSTELIDTTDAEMKEEDMVVAA